MAKFGYTMVQQCKSCGQDSANTRHHLKLQRFPLGDPLGFVPMDILGSLAKKNEGKQFPIIVTSRYSKLKRAILTEKFTSTRIETTNIYHQVMSYGIPTYYLTDNGPQLVE